MSALKKRTSSGRKTVATPKLAPKVTKGERTRTRCIDHFIERVAKVGLRNVTLENLAGELEMYRSQLVYHFQSLDELAVAAYTKILDHARSQIGDEASRLDAP